MISAARYLRNCVKCTRDGNVRRLGCTCLSAIHHWRYLLEIKFVFVTKVNISLGICQKLIRSVGSPQALFFIIFGLESWAGSNDSGTRRSITRMELFLLGHSTVRPPSGARPGDRAEERAPCWSFFDHHKDFLAVVWRKGILEWLRFAGSLSIAEHDLLWIQG